MLKFLRKYQTWLLAVGGCLLMIVFVAPQAVQQFGPNPLKRQAGTLDGREIKVIDLELAQRELAVLNRLMPGIMMGLGVEDRDSVHWLLLTEAADRAGLVGGAGAWNELAPQLIADVIARDGVQPGTPEYDTAYPNAVAIVENLRLQFAADMRIAGDRSDPVAKFDMAVAKALGAQRLAASLYSAPRLSEARVIRAGRDMNDRTNATIMFASADIIDLGWNPTDDVLRAHLDRYRDVRPGEAEDGTPYGYLLPPRVKLRWLMLERTLIRDAIEIDPVEVRKRWQLDQETYGEDFAAAREQIENEIRNQEADRILVEADRLVRTEVLAATRRLEKDSDDYFVLPDDWSTSGPRFDEIAGKLETLLAEQTGTEIRRPGVGALIEWTTFQELGDVPLIGRAAARVGNRRYPVAALAAQAKELELTDTPIAKVQIGVPVVEPTMRDNQGNQYYFVLTDAREESEPASFEEIRGQLAEDARTLARYEALRDRLDTLLTQARASGIRSVADELNAGAPEPTGPGETKVEAEVVGAVQVRRSFVMGPSNIADPLIRDAVMDRSAGIDPTLTGEDIPESERFVSVEVPNRTGIAIAEIERITPMTREFFQSSTGNVLARSISNEFVDVISAREESPFSKEALAERLRWQPSEAADDFEASDDEANADSAA
ncbi:MAG: hypothetical protein AAGK04_05885 [Planctomycetota bacterium]